LACTIAVSGKGGSGKTTVAGLLIRALIERGATVLAVDADPNSCLGEFLGVRPQRTIADIREEVLAERQAASPGVPKERIIEYELQACVVEAQKFDLITMGRPEGPRCYCYVNHLLRSYLDRLAGDYPYVVIDNEAGMEHLSRRTTDDVDLLVVVAEPTVLGAQTARRIFRLADSLPLAIRRREVWLNKVAGEVSAAVLAEVRGLGAAQVEAIPYDESIYRGALAGRDVFAIGAESAARQRVAALADRIAAGRA